MKEQGLCRLLSVTAGPRNLDIYFNEVSQANFLPSVLVKMGCFYLLNSFFIPGSPSHELPLHTHPPVPVSPVATQAFCFLKLAEPGICEESEKPSRRLLRRAVCAVWRTHSCSILLVPSLPLPSPTSSFLGGDRARNYDRETGSAASATRPAHTRRPSGMAKQHRKRKPQVKSGRT